MFASHTLISGGTFTNNRNDHVHYHGFRESAGILHRATATTAFHNSGERFDPTKCPPAVLTKLMKWIKREENLDAFIMWMYGPAGAGKSAIAQTIAEMCEEEMLLLASFSFSRNDPSRSTVKPLIATIAYQIMVNIPDLRDAILGAIDRDPLIFSKFLAVQVKALIVAPLQQLAEAGLFKEPTCPRLIIIDGLDECFDPKVQQNIMDVLAKAKRQHQLPLIFLISSRPEKHISLAFSTGPVLPSVTTRMALEESYLERLEKKAAGLDKLLRRLCPDETGYNELNSSLDSNRIMEQSSVDPGTLFDETTLQVQANTKKVGTYIAAQETHDEDDSTSALVDLKRMALTPSESRFVGKSSDIMLVWKAMELRKEYTGNGESRNAEKPVFKHRRTEFWEMEQWVWRPDATASPTYTFPELDLALHCTDLYFKRDNLYLPLLHRPTFDRSVQEGRHLEDEKFARVFLLVCAVGARYSDDPRVLLDAVDPSHSSGWKWFNQVQTMKRSLISPPTVEDLQSYCLCIQFLTGSNCHESCATLVGVALHLAQDAGAHRRHANSHTLTPEEELWKRAFWALVCMDRMVSPAMGRPCSIQEEDFDLDLPVDCDDEYWDNPDPEKRFKQPPNKPSLITAYILRLKLHQILAMCLRTIYSINKSKTFLDFAAQQGEQDLVAALDSKLNKWVDSIPDHLRWNPNREDGNFFNQSVALYAEYYHLQIVIHRPFIPSPSKPRPLTFPSLAICTNAARSCIHILHIQGTRNNFFSPHTLTHTFTAGIILLLGIWGAKRSNLLTNPTKEMAEVHRCMELLKVMEKQFWGAGRFWDMMNDLASKTSTGELPLSRPSPPWGTRQTHESGTSFPTESSLNPTSQNKTLGTTPSSVPKEPSFAELTQSALSRSLNADPPEFALPVYSNELGSLPLHGQVSFSTQAHDSQLQTYLPAQTDHWYSQSGIARSEPTSAGPRETSSSYGLHHAGPSVPPLQQQPPQQHSHHVPRSISTDEFSLTSEVNSRAQGSYGVVSPNTSGAFESPLDDNHPHIPEYGLRPMDLLSSNMGSNPPPPLSGGPLTDNMYSGMAEDPMSAPAHSTYQQQQGIPVQQDSYYPFALESNTAEVWSNAPTGFELDQWGAYLTEMMQSSDTHAST
ncbi:hypothetical protein M413DRAFT_440395 [Hebeloma cylindrosporum]|uniref:Xylanolytic transcriptional activator regulatory domain-containing protein n=1 Tax=Hebeloma cylindrosporum TaxID=76867 RepID=A0A0C3CSE8_HEBCY|nr:hypothetical protein M413DRAFT_440395 [Hebeloma cylindrosporum h7]